MNTYNFSGTLLDLKNNPVGTLSDALAEFIGSQTKGKTAKLYYWYTELKREKTLSLDEVDKEELIDIIDKSETMYIFAKGQILEVLKN